MADVILNITIPDAMTKQALAAFTKISGTHMTIEARGSNPDPAQDFNARWDFRIEPKSDVETPKQFGQRVLRQLGIAIIKMVDKAEDDVRYRTQVAAVTPPVSDVSDDVLI